MAYAASAGAASAETQMLDKKNGYLSRNFGHFDSDPLNMSQFSHGSLRAAASAGENALATPYATPVVLNALAAFVAVGKSSKRRDASSRSRTIAHERQRWLLHHH